MKLELDFDNKLITISSIGSLKEFVEKVKELNLDDWNIGGKVEYVPYYPTIPSYPIYKITCSTNYGCKEE